MLIAIALPLIVLLSPPSECEVNEVLLSWVKPRAVELCSVPSWTGPESFQRTADLTPF